jgi:hypothetical protein
VDAEHLRWHIWSIYCRDRCLSHDQIGREFGLSTDFVGMVLKGSREPSQAFLDAFGFERVTLYRLKSVTWRNCFFYGAGRCDITPADQRCQGCPCDEEA